MTNWQVHAGGTLRGTVKVPGDKSISHRFIMLASLANGVSVAEGILLAEDTLATAKAFEAMGVNVVCETEADLGNKILTTRAIVTGRGFMGLEAPKAALDFGNSGTAMRLMSGLLCAQSFSSELIGDMSLMSRPMTRIANPLSQMGAHIYLNENGCAPINISPLGKPLEAICYQLPVASAQVKSAILLAGLYADGDTVIIEAQPTRDHSERMLKAFGYDVASNVIASGKQITVRGKGCETNGDLNADSPIDVNSSQENKGLKMKIPADISSAAFFMVAACIAPESSLTLVDVGINPTRTGIISILQLMGANIKIENRRMFGGEPVSDIVVSSSQLRGIDIPKEFVPLAIDEFPVIMVAAASAVGTTRLFDAEELRVKETDRIAAVADGLTNIGIKVSAWSDGMEVTGGTIKGGIVNSYGDHRIAMAFAIAALRSEAPISISDCDNVATSFPAFVTLANSVGMRIDVD